MTRLLVPEMFGVMAIVIILMMAMNMFSDIGIGTNIVQKKGELSDSYLNTAWTLQIIKGFLLWIVMAGIAWSLSFQLFGSLIRSESVYAHPELPVLIVVVGVSVIISSLHSTTAFTDDRALRQMRLTVIEVLGSFSAVLVMIGLGLLNPSIWALAAGAITGASVKSLMTHIYLDHRSHRLALDRSACNEILSFGKWIVMSSIAMLLLTQGDRLILESFISATELGVYSIALLICMAISQAFQKIGRSVLLPALSDVGRRDPARVSATYYSIRLRQDIPVIFVCGLLMVMGSELIDFLYDERYTKAGEMLEVLALSLLGLGFGISTICLTAIGKPRLLAISNTIRAVALWVLTPVVFLNAGLHAAIWVIATNFVVALPLQF